MRRKVASLVMGFAVLFSPTAAFAQDMSFELEEEGGAEEPEAKKPAGPPPEEGPPSEAFANGLRLYDQRQYSEASVLFQRVVDGGTKEAEGNRHKARFWLAKSLYHLGFYQSALVLFDEIGQAGTSHLYFDQTLQWLAQLATQLPEPAGIIEKVGRFGVDQLDAFRGGAKQPMYDRLVYLMGRSKYAVGEFEEAIKLFDRVSRCSDVFVEAQFFVGIAQVRLRHARPAISAFRSILDAVEECDVPDADRMTNLAWLSLGRVYYTAANRQDPETLETTIDGRLLGAAVDAWSRVEQSSEYWLDALFEASWAFFLADEFARALGNIHTLFSPFFQDVYYPEAQVLKAVTFFVNCQIDNARAMVGKFHDQYDPVQAELTEVVERYKDDNLAFFDFLKRVREGTANLSPRIRAIVSTALSDRDLLRDLEYVRLLDEEQKRLDAAPAEFKSAAVGVRILQDIDFARTFAVDAAGDKARGRYLRVIDELQELMNQIDTVEVETINYMRGQLSQELQAQQTAAAEAGKGDVEVDEEHQVWPFNGEYWRDELGFYRQQVTNQCGR